MNPRILDTDPLDLPGAGPCCPCHDTAGCPDQATVTIRATQLGDLADLLGVLDEFLRCGNGAVDRLADFYAGRGQTHPRFTANNLIDAVSFTAAALHPHQDGDHS